MSGWLVWRSGRSTRRAPFRAPTGADPSQFLQISEYPTWGEHLRQHTGRLTGADQALYEQAMALAIGPPEVRHLFLPHPEPEPAPDDGRR
jgi:hypothetical protein